MTRSEKFLCAIYAVIAVAALIATWINVLAFILQPANWDFQIWYNAIYANYAAAAILNDLLALTIAACIFIAVEGRRLHLRFIWVYLVLSFAIAISVTFPLFLIARQFRLAQQRQAESR
jgi:hypothetical protein